MRLKSVLLLLAAYLPIGHACRVGYQPLFDGKCMRYVDSYEIINNGIKECQNQGTYPPSIHSYDENSYFLDAVRNYGNNNNAILGFICKGGRVQWWDGSAMNFNLFESDDDRDCDDGSIPHVAIRLNSGYWYKVGWLDLEYIDIFCEEKAIKENHCGPGFFSTTVGGVQLCYYIIESHGYTWKEAEDFCYNDYGHLPSIHSVEMNNYIKRSALGESQTKMYIGLRGNNEGNFAWIDGTPFDYNNFQNGFPATGLGNYGVMNVASGGQWINSDGNEDSYFICTQPEQGSNPAPPCPTSTLYGNGTISSPGFPWKADTACTFHLQVANGYRVELNIRFLEANKCCDSLTVSSNGNTIKRLTGSHQTGVIVQANNNEMTVNWSGGGVNVKGFTADFRTIKDNENSRIEKEKQAATTPSAFANGRNLMMVKKKTQP